MAEVRGRWPVGGTFCGRARAARPMLVGPRAGLVWMQHGRPQMVFDFTIADGKVVRIDLIGDPERIGQLDLTIVDA